jgi:predicted kinase
MNKSTLVLVIGHPASGKTTLAHQIAEELHIPLLSKDDTIKEPMYETLETSGREWSFKIGIAAFRIMANIIEEQLKSGYSMVVESTFKYEPDNVLFAEWQKKYGFKVVQVLCEAPASILAKRYMERIKSGERHKGHGDEHMTEESVLAEIERLGSIKAFKLEGPVIRFDSSTFSSEKTEQALQLVRSALEKSNP